MHHWLAEPMPKAVAQAMNRLAAARGVVHIAVMPDVHLAENVCVGTVVATDDCLYPQAVGGDIGCGMAAVRLQADGNTFTGKGADPDTLVSSAKAYLSALNKLIAKRERLHPQHGTVAAE